ncbi:MAG: twin-arginine translocase subunit TatC [Candidatus Sericytochromatia bacterium]|nr:twin-arginine translocase subunit TatC [Candidatus Sericytochromatia bacterium]
MTVIEHLEELRWRIFKSLGAVLAAAIAIFAFHAPIIHLLERPLHRPTGPLGLPPLDVVLIFTGPGEYFVAVIKLSLLGGLYLALPVLLYQLLAFVGPGLLSHERRLAIPTVTGAFVLFTAGMVFAYFLMLPAGLQFLVGFAPPEVKPMLSIGKYLGFSGGLMFATGLSFELPLFLLAASALGLVTSYSLAEHRRSAVVVALILAALLTPSVDIFSQIVLGAALYGLFEFSLLLIRLTGK